MTNFVKHIGIFFIIAMFFATSVYAAPPAKEFGKLPQIYDAAISPDGKKIAAYVNMNGGYGIGIFYIDDSNRDPVALGMEEGVKPRWIRWANDEIVLASIWQNSKIQFTPITSGFIYSFDIKSKKGKILISPNKTKRNASKIGPNNVFRQFNNHVVDFLNSDPDHILMSFSDTDVSVPEVQKVDVRSGSYKRVKRGAANIQNWYTDLRGEIRVGQGRADKTKSIWNLRIRDAHNEKWNDFNEFPGLKANVDIFGFTSDPNEMVIGSYAGKDTVGLYVYDLGQKQVTRKLFHHDEYDAEDLIYNSSGTEIVGASYIADTEQIQLFGESDTTLQTLRNKYADFSVDYIDSAADNTKVLVRISSPSDSGGVFLLDAKSGDIKLISAHYDGLSATELGLVISLKYTARDGQKIPAYVTLPPAVRDTPSNLPFIILPHGGPYARDSKSFDYLAQFFATRGFGVLQMNFRGSVGYGKKYEQAGRKNWVVMQEDVEDGMRWLLKKGYADPERTCIAGWSYGGYAALIGSIKNPELYACTISMAGVTDLQDRVNDLRKYQFGNAAAKGFLKGFENKDDIKENSPVKRAEELKSPVFLAHGTLDQRVHFDQYKRMKSALKKSSAQVTAIEFKDEDHFLSNQKNRIEFFEELEEFLEKSVGKSEHMTD